MRPFPTDKPVRRIWYDPRRMRRLTYRHAITAFFFTGCWIVFGFLFLLSPIPGTLGIAAGLIEVWLLLTFVTLALSGGVLTMAAINGIFPPQESPPSRPSRPTPLRNSEPGPDAQAWTRPLSRSTTQGTARANRR